MNAQPSAPEIPFRDLPEGTVTFLFTDIEGSTQLLDRLRDRYAVLLADQRRILREAFDHWNGHEVDTQGDAFFVAFSRATQAVGAAAEAQRRLAGHAWPEGVTVRVRMGIHTGEPWSGEEGYVGMDVHRAARIAHVAHGGQVLLSETTAALVLAELPGGLDLVDLGRHLLKDIHRPERICQLVIEGLPSEFPDLKSLEKLPSESARPKRQVGACPYRGLSAFQEGDAPFYFGREAFVDALEQAVRTKKLVAVIVGSSGSGKSSALFAGLLPRLRKAGGYQVASFRPGSQPFYALAGALLPLLDSGLSETDRLVETRKLAERLVKGEVSLAEVTKRILEKAHGAKQVLLVIDQFEELYTLCPDAKLQKALVDELLATVEAARAQKDPSSVILLTLRADFMGQALTHRPFADALQEASLLMGPMTRPELHMAIEKPAGMQGAAFEPGLVERILDDVGEKPGNLPLLEFTLTQLWERQTDGWLTHADYEGMGCVEGALAAYADQVYAELEADEQERARRALVELVQPGEGTEDTRRIANREELGDESWPLIQRLADRRLVVTGRDAQGRETAEVVHEALIQKWDRFKEWMNADRAFRVWQERLRGSLRQWQETGQDEGALLAGAPLAVAQSWVSERRDDISQAEVNYIEAGLARQARHQKERQRRRQWAVLGLAGGLVIALALAGLALFQRQNALRQASIGLASQAQLEMEGAFPERSVLLALEALENYPYTWQAERALGQVVQELRLRFILSGHTDVVQDAAWSPDGSLIATCGQDGALRIWDAQTYVEMRKIAAHSATNEGGGVAGAWVLAWAPDGKRIATGGYDGTAKVWDARTGELITAFPGHTDEVSGVAWSPDGIWIASSSADKTAKVWNARTGEERFTLSGHTEWVNIVAWSPDGTGLATSSDDGTARIWDAATGEERLKFSGHKGMVTSVAWSPDGKQLASAGADGTVRVWDPSSGDELSDLRLAGTVWDAAWSPDGLQLATTSEDGLARVWDVATGTEQFSLQGRITQMFFIAWSPDGKWLATTAGGSSEVRIWDALPMAPTLSENEGGIIWASWSPDGKRIATTNIGTGDAVIWDSETREALVKIATGAAEGELQDVFWSPDGSRIVTTAWNQLAQVWDANTGQELLKFTGHVGEPPLRLLGATALFGGGWSPDGSRILTGGDSARVWDARTGQEILQHKMSDVVGASPRWSPDGKRLATCSTMRDGIHVLDAATWAPILGGDFPSEADVAVGDSLEFCSGVEWSPDGNRILGVDWVGAVAIWDAKTGKKILEFKEHSGPLMWPAWSPNGKRIATLDRSGTIKIWDAESGTVLLSYSVGGQGMNVSWSPDGEYLIAAVLERSVEIHRVWQSPEDLVNYARKYYAFRSLTDAERQQYGLK